MVTIFFTNVLKVKVKGQQNKMHNTYVSEEFGHNKDTLLFTYDLIFQISLS